MRTDEEIIQLVLAGQTHLFEEILSRYEGKIYGSAFKATRNEQDALDVTQEIFIKVYKNLKQFQGNAAFSTWIYRVSMNGLYDFIRKRKRETARQEALQQAYLVEEKAGEELPFAFTEEVRAAVAKLPEAYQQTIRHYYYEEKSYDQIATEMQVSVKTVESRLYRARKLLKDSVEKEVSV